MRSTEYFVLLCRYGTGRTPYGALTHFRISPDEVGSTTTNVLFANVVLAADVYPRNTETVCIAQHTLHPHRPIVLVGKFYFTFIQNKAHTILFFLLPSDQLSDKIKKTKSI